MKIFFSQADASPEIIEEDFSPIDLKESIRKTRQALEIAYAGFDNALESDLIDSYIYEINALQKRYQHLTELAALQPAFMQDRKSTRLNSSHANESRMPSSA